ncbi:Maternal embryonic leucine zipper kinase [Halotydeus destructor]|nr:Maternal embryonic leucine zipper kinase [Halotydeus destructor]
MLQVDPKKRVAVKDLLKNDWINNGNKDPIVIYREHLDEEIVWDVSKIFKRMPVALLRQNVISGLGYQRATYWILRSRKEKGCSQAVVPMYSSPKSKQTFITKSTDTVLEQIREEKEVAAEHDYVNVTKSNEALSTTSEGRPSVVAQQMKRKLVTNEHHFTVYDKEDNPTPAKARYTPSKVRQNPRCVPKPPTAPSTPARMSTPLKERTTPAPLSVTKTTEIPVPKTPNKVLSPVDINRKKTFTLLNTPKDKSMISPTPNRRMKMLFGKSPLKENPELETPSKMLIPSTPKRSLMKRILAAATPSDKPRMLSTRTTAKNITMTNFNDAQECINKLIQVISQKGYHCKQKGYTISCAKVNKYTGDDHISFDLEICQFADRCAIQRKRLRGDAWFYKKICEEILRVSNGEHVMESQV